MNKFLFLSTLFIATVLVACKPNNPDNTSEEASVKISAPTISKSEYGTLENGAKVDEYTMKNGNGMELKVITYGGIITKWSAPDRNGKYENIVLGFDNLQQYVSGNPYFGAIIGRYGNRIANGNFKLDGKSYQLEKNDGPNHLHGGVKGFDKVVWNASSRKTEDDVSLVLKYESADMEGGYPGNLMTEVIYTLTNDNTLEVTYQASTDKPTIVNLTQHSYFNLSGDFSQSIVNHILEINADQYVPVDATLIPTGDLASVEGTPFDFTDPKVIGQDINADDQQITLGKGFDHCWVLNNPGSMRNAANLFHSNSGRFLEIDTDEPGIQFYSGNFLDGTLPMAGGGTYGHRTGLCLETQHYPDSPNQPSFPSVRLNPGEQYNSKTTFKFSTR